MFKAPSATLSQYPLMLVLAAALPVMLQAQDDTVYRGNVGGYTSVGKAQVDQAYDAGYPEYAYLALTPPMGWNSWNYFAKDINEVNIKATADAMAASGMREAGYQYLVLDDAWMAPERDENGALQADPNKFPKGMKDIGDYIHSKGLKFGIYEDRAYRTCQSLPGSHGHEQIDMATFAAWGVDYIKLDSCSAEGNGRLSSEDYAIYRECIEATGRDMVLSISDFGNAAWVWGGKDTSQLWRTGWDIRSWMDSVYNCAECSGGSHRSHPAFNGLWQFAGPGHWNDPDMLQVGNFKIEDETVSASANKAHFGNRVLWDSGQMTKDSPAKTFDIELENYNCIMLTLDGRNIETGKRANDVLGVFGNPRIIAND